MSKRREEDAAVLEYSIALNDALIALVRDNHSRLTKERERTADAHAEIARLKERIKELTGEEV